MKYYVVRVNKKTGEKHYMRTKTVGGWSVTKTNCCQFSKQGANGIVRRYSGYTHPVYTGYEYGIEAVEQ